MRWDDLEPNDIDCFASAWQAVATLRGTQQRRIDFNLSAEKQNELARIKSRGIHHVLIPSMGTRIEAVVVRPIRQ